MPPIESIIHTSLSSRTDAGVHAVSNTMHLDLKLKKDFSQFANDNEFASSFLKEEVNEHLVKNNLMIRYFSLLKLENIITILMQTRSI